MTLDRWNGKELTKRLVLQEARNKYGEFKVATHFEKDKWSKHIDVMEIWEKEEWWRLDKANNRTIFKNELVLDLDPEEGETKEETLKKAKEIARELDKRGLSFKSYFSGSRGYHFHLLFGDLLVFKNITQFKKLAIKKFKCDLMKAGDSSMIALEWAKHWKTGNIKEEVMLK